MALWPSVYGAGSHCVALRPLCWPQVGRAGRFGTKGLAITFVASPQDSEVLNQVQVCVWEGSIRQSV